MKAVRKVCACAGDRGVDERILVGGACTGAILSADSGSAELLFLVERED